MICVISKNSKFCKELEKVFAKHSVAIRIVDASLPESVGLLYEPDVIGAVVDADVDHLPHHAWLDMLVTLGKRIPVVVLGKQSDKTSHSDRARYTETVTWLNTANADDVISILDACGAVGLNGRKLDRSAIPVFNPQVPLHMLQNNGALSVIVINASSFRKIAIEYGSEAYNKVQDAFYQIVYDLWGAAGSFRTSDILCRKSLHSNSYYIFLEQSRSQSGVPMPTILEKLTERLAIKLQNSFWEEMFKRPNERILPSCLEMVPEIAVGFNTTLYNPCVDVNETVDKMLDSALAESKSQLNRTRNRQKELMHTLIQTPGLLRPNYQAVFQLQTLTKEMVDEHKKTKSIRPLESLIFGFESLIRVNQDYMSSFMEESGLTLMDPKYMRPDVLFAMAHSTKLVLELDQVCLQHAAVNSVDLTGKLMCNILPRNLYHIDRLKHLIMDCKEIIFEVSEKEAINNFELMLQVREQMERMNMGIATDDFGKGYAGLEQIIRVKPDVIKLDRSLIQDIHLDAPKQAFVIGLVEAARTGNALILAEGVELWEEAILLKEMGIDLIQGFLLHMPQSAELITEDLNTVDQTLDTVA
jgi:EAL domain-containing protein (putative c-di-GMP-specific phosphodiesterase class I)